MLQNYIDDVSELCIIFNTFNTEYIKKNYKYHSCYINNINFINTDILFATDTLLLSVPILRYFNDMCFSRSI